jgi:hypothetical protein
MTQLYKLTNDAVAAITDLTKMFEAGDIDSDTATATIEGIQGELKDKAVNVALHIKNLRSDMDQLLAERDLFSQRADSIKKQLDFYESYLDLNLRKAGIDSIVGTKVEIKFKKMPDIVDITGEVPVEYSRTIPAKVEPDKVAIKSALKDGNELGFAVLLTGRTKLEIK